MFPFMYITKLLRKFLPDDRKSAEGWADIKDEPRLLEDTALTLGCLLCLGVFALVVVFFAQWDLSHRIMSEGLTGHGGRSAAISESQPALHAVAPPPPATSSEPTTASQPTTVLRPAGVSEPVGGASGDQTNNTAASNSGKGIETDSKRDFNGIALALLWSLAMFCVGSLVGFIFGVPKIAQGADTEKTPSRTRPNASLEEISDWLTKIIVGVGLVEAKDIGGRIYAMAEIMSREECGIACVSLALAIIITFVSIGFFMGYFATRMFLSPSFGRADGIAERISQRFAKGTYVGLNTTGNEAPIDQGAKEEAHLAVKQTEAAKGTGSFDTRYLRAKSLLISGDYYNAAVEYGALVAERPTDVKLRRERLWAMFKRGPQWNAEIAGAVKELDEMSSRVLAEEAPDVYLSLTFHYLYAGTEAAAERVVKLVWDYERRQLPHVAGIYINLACAHGQLAKLRFGKVWPQWVAAVTDNTKTDEQQRISIRVAAQVSMDASNAAAAAQKAIEASPEGAKARLRELLSAGGDDDDLAEPEVAKAVRDVLDRTAATTAVKGAEVSTPKAQPS